MHIGRTVSGSFGDVFHNAVRYWEPRRAAYNLVLAGVAAGWLLFTWPHFRPALTLQSLFYVLILAAIANACYCAAYIVDIAIQHSAVQAAWRRWRWSLWLLGMLIAAALSHYWIADEIYPYVHLG